MPQTANATLSFNRITKRVKLVGNHFLISVSDDGI